MVAIDIDGTIAEYHGHLKRFCIDYWNLRKTDNLLGSYWDGDGEFEDYLGLTKEQYREAKLAFRQGGMKRTMPLYPDAVRLVNGVGLRAEVWLTTARPWQRLDNVDPDTKFWLARHGLKYDHLLFGDDKYGDLCNIVDYRRIVAVIDDLPEQIDRANELGLPAFQRHNFHNQAASEKRVPGGSLADALEWTLGKLDIWDKTNERVGAF